MAKHIKSKFVSYRIDPPIYDALTAIKDQDGIPLSEQMRRALRLWLAQRGVAIAARKGTR